MHKFAQEIRSKDSFHMLHQHLFSWCMRQQGEKTTAHLTFVASGNFTSQTLTTSHHVQERWCKHLLYSVEMF